MSDKTILSATSKSDRGLRVKATGTDMTDGASLYDKSLDINLTTNSVAYNGFFTRLGGVGINYKNSIACNDNGFCLYAKPVTFNQWTQAA